VKTSEAEGDWRSRKKQEEAGRSRELPARIKQG